MNDLPADPNISLLPLQLKILVFLFIFAFPFFLASCENLSALPSISYSEADGLTISTTLKVIKSQPNSSK